jgi:hypothetical protein
MQAEQTLPRPGLNLLLWLLAAAGVTLLGIVPLLLQPGSDAAPAAVADSQRVAYFEFGAAADVLWSADPSNPSRRKQVAAFPHAEGFGIVPSLAPDRRSFAYTALPVSLNAPSTQSPAELWLATAAGAHEPRLLAADADLPAPAVWTPDGAMLVYRSSGTQQQDASAYRLITVTPASGQVRELVRSNGAALFAVGFSADGRGLYFVRLDAGASSLWLHDLASGAEREVARLAGALSRDWTLSPGRDRMAYLAMTPAAAMLTSRAYVLDLATGRTEPVETAGDAFSPVWDTAGGLTVGSSGLERHRASLVHAFTDTGFDAAAPRRGFDVPLAYAANGARLVVRSFDGASALAPGRPRLELLGAGGSRKTITDAEVTLLGWIDP